MQPHFLIQTELLKRKEQEVSKLRKELETANLGLETAEHNMKRKHQTTIMEFTTEIETLQKLKGK